LKKEKSMLRVYLDVGGQEALIKGHPLYTWNYLVRGPKDEAPAYGVLIGEFEPALPQPETCVLAVLEKLKAREVEIQAEAQEEVQKIVARRNAVMMLGHTA
jgi:hypothetical protein